MKLIKQEIKKYINDHTANLLLIQEKNRQLSQIQVITVAKSIGLRREIDNLKQKNNNISNIIRRLESFEKLIISAFKEVGSTVGLEQATEFLCTYNQFLADEDEKLLSSIIGQANATIKTLYEEVEDYSKNLSLVQRVGSFFLSLVSAIATIIFGISCIVTFFILMFDEEPEYFFADSTKWAFNLACHYGKETITGKEPPPHLVKLSDEIVKSKENLSDSSPKEPTFFSNTARSQSSEIPESKVTLSLSST